MGPTGNNVVVALKMRASEWQELIAEGLTNLILDKFGWHTKLVGPWEERTEKVLMAVCMELHTFYGS